MTKNILGVWCLLIWLTLVGIAPLRAQKPPVKFERLSGEQGLSQSAVYCMQQDRQGFMWFGTEDGLNKYDGYNFIVYRHNGLDSNSLSNSFITAIYEDRAGVLWIGTFGGLNKFDPETAQFTRFVYAPKDHNSLSHNRIRVIYEDHTGMLWLGTWGGLKKFDREQGQFTPFINDPKNPGSLSSNSVLSIYEDCTGTLWIGTGKGLNKFDREKNIFEHFFYDPANPSSLSHNNVQSIYEDHTRTLWIGTMGGGLNKFDREKRAFSRFVLGPSVSNNPSKSVTKIFEDRTGALWLGTWGGGLYQFDPAQSQFTRFVHDPNDPHSLNNNTICSIYEDRSGILWVGTDTGGGLNKLDLAKERFRHIAHDPNNPNSLNQNNTWAIYEDRAGVFWIGTEGGLNRFDREKRQFTRFVHNPKDHHSLSNNEITSIYEDSGNTLWIGTKGGGLNKFDREKEKFVRFVNDMENSRSLSQNFVTSICEDHTHTLWIGTRYGLNKFNREKAQFARYFYNSTDGNSSISAIFEDQNDALWIGTANGLNKFDPQNTQNVRFISAPNNPGGLSDPGICCIFEDHAGTLWIGTFDGLNKFDRATGQFIRYTEKDGLPNDLILGILEDNNGNLWLSTNKGLSRFNPQKKNFRNYDVSDGLQSNEFNAGASYKSKSGEMFFGGINGFNVFHPDSIRDNPYIPPLQLTRFICFNADEAQGSAIVDENISAKKQVALSYRDNILTFEFAALSYRNNTKNQYAYKLEGFNDNWIQLGTRREVTFTNLDPGEYTLRVKGSNNDGIWNETGTSLKITITPPWWKTKWAYMLYILAVMSLLYGLRRYELNRLLLKNQLHLEHVEADKMKELDQLKSRFFANISHEFRTPLTLILGPVEQMRRSEFKGNLHEAYDMILRNGQRLLRLINQLLDLARLEAGGMSLQARPENIVSLLKGFVLSFASAAERHYIQLSITAEEESLMVYFDRDKLEKIVSNLLSNALKFTPAGGSVTVRIEGFDNKEKSLRGVPPFFVGTTKQAAIIEREGVLRPAEKRGTRNDGFVEISVKDTGSGIPVDQLDKIFDRFHQVVASRTSTSSVQEHEGTGIGLALTKELVDLHHGEILVESAVGRGTTFIVRLPLGKAHLRTEEIVSEQLSVGSNQSARIDDGELKIEDRESNTAMPSIQQPNSPSLQEPATGDAPLLLVIEDNRDVRTYIRQYLEPAFKVIEAEDGVEGVAQALEMIPDLIICDVMMPKRDGYEVCRILKTDAKTSHVPIIMLTAKADRESKVQGWETGADDYLLKPFDAHEMLARVHNLIKLRKQLCERFSREITLQLKDIALTSMDEQFLQRAMQIVEEHISENELGVEFLAHKIGMSRVHLNRKLRGLTDQTANEFIRTLRLKRAAQLLAKKSATVLEIAYEVGFSNPSYFAECFEKQFGVLPSKFAE